MGDWLSHLLQMHQKNRVFLQNASETCLESCLTLTSTIRC